MKRIVKTAIASVFVLIVGTLPHSVGAMFTQAKERLIQPVCDMAKLPIKQAKKLAKEFGHQRAMQEWHNIREWNALYILWSKESRWDYTAKNKNSTAYGIPQILDLKQDTTIYQQVDMGIKYIKHRYGTPTRALAFHNAYGWY